MRRGLWVLSGILLTTAFAAWLLPRLDVSVVGRAIGPKQQRPAEEPDPAHHYFLDEVSFSFTEINEFEHTYVVDNSPPDFSSSMMMTTMGMSWPGGLPWFSLFGEEAPLIQEMIVQHDEHFPSDDRFVGYIAVPDDAPGYVEQAELKITFYPRGEAGCTSEVADPAEVLIGLEYATSDVDWTSVPDHMRGAETYQCSTHSVPYPCRPEFDIETVCHEFVYPSALYANGANPVFRISISNEGSVNDFINLKRYRLKTFRYEAPLPPPKVAP